MSAYLGGLVAVGPPDEPALVAPAGLAEPAGDAGGAAVAAKLLAAAAAAGPPAALRHVGLAAALRARADAAGHRLPGRPVAVPGADQGVGHLVQQRLAHLLQRVALDEVDRQADALLAEAAHAQRAQAPREGERPALQAELSQDRLGPAAHHAQVLA